MGHRRETYRRDIGSTRRRILIVNCHFDDTHRPIARPRKLPRATGPVYLAGAFSPRGCDIRLYDEVSGGPLEDEGLLGWPDMLVLTGLTNSFDRMLHLTAYARTKSPRVVVVAGGPAVRALPGLAVRFFDYPCTGDVEQMRAVAADALGSGVAAEEMVPRYDLAHWLGGVGQVETSRYCNFRCAFCALTGEGHAYRPYDPHHIRRQLLAMGKRDHLLLIDNNFYGNDRRQFAARLEVIREFWERGFYRDWAAILTNDFFHKEENLHRVRAAGCTTLFSGVESFDGAWLRQANKLQNTGLPQVEMIRRCLEAGIVFAYGLILDPTTRPVADLRRELEFITGTPEIPLPAFLTLPIPLVGTPFFRECLAKGAFLPLTKLRDLDGTTVTLRPLDPLEEVVNFVRDMVRLRGYRARALRHAAGFARRYGRRLTPLQMVVALSGGALLSLDTATTAGWRGTRQAWHARPRTHLTTTEPLDAVYTPAFRVDSRYQQYFRPTMVTDAGGEVAEQIAASGLLEIMPAPPGHGLEVPLAA